MTSQEFPTNCKIYDYIQQVDPELAKIMHMVCVEGSLIGRKHGVTFLHPKDKDVRDKLKKLASSQDPDKANEAGDMLNAMILRDTFKTSQDWMDKQSRIPNSLYPSQHVEVDKVTSKEVIFKSGAKATLDEKFIDASKKRNLAVWTLTGSIPLNGTPLAKDEPKTASKKKTGNYEPGVALTWGIRFKIAVAVENTYALQRAERSLGVNRRPRDAYSDAVLSLVHHVLIHDDNMELFMDRILPMISFDKFDFYALIEPHTSGPFLLETSLIQSWWDARTTTIWDCKLVTSAIMKQLDVARGTCAIYSNRQAIFKELVDIRADIDRASKARPRDFVNIVSGYYKTLEQTNKIGRISNVFPKGVAEYYAAHPGLKMRHDEMRYVTYVKFANIENRKFDYGAYHELVNLIGNTLHDKSSTLFNPNTIKYAIDAGNIIREINIFVYSTMFMYFPSKASETVGKTVITRPEPYQCLLYNISKCLVDKHQRLFLKGPGTDNAALMEALRSLDLKNLDPRLAQLINEQSSKITGQIV